MTERLYYNDCYIRQFEANIVGRDGNKITSTVPPSIRRPEDNRTTSALSAAWPSST